MLRTISPFTFDDLCRNMSDNGLFGESGENDEIQSGLSLDDGSGLRVVRAKFLSEQKFEWTYSMVTIPSGF